jgi:hypothetical protein
VRDEGDDDAIGTGSPGSSGTVHIVGVVGWRVEMDDEGHIVDVDAACRDVRGDEDVESAGSEGSQGTLPLSLAAVAMNGRGLQTRASQTL